MVVNVDQNGRPPHPARPPEPVWACIPTELTTIPRWVNWRYSFDQKRGKWTKDPWQPDFSRASSTDAQTWSEFEHVQIAYETIGYDGIGFVVSDADEICGFDFDHVLDADARIIDPQVAERVARLDSYTEVSPGGDGLRVFVKGKLPPEGRKIGGFECYENARFLSVTGRHFLGTPLTINKRQEAIDAVHAAMFAERIAKQKEAKERASRNGKSSGQSAKLDDEELLKRARGAKNATKFAVLYDTGDWKVAGFQSHSEADLALCSMLAFWVQGDAARVDALFRGSALMSDKWERDDYRAGTIAKALAGKSEYYEPKPAKQPAAADGAGAGHAEAGQYRETAAGIVRIESKNKNEIPHQLTNFTARIIADVSHDDGAEIARNFEITITQGPRSATATVPVERFPAMRWPIEAMGAQAVVYAGQGCADHARAAIQLLSGTPVRRVVYGHTGWRKIGGVWCYLHGAGAIGADGVVEGIEVALPPELAAFKLELPADREAERRVVRASLKLLDLGPDPVTVPLFGAVVRAVLGGADFAIFLFGPTGLFKTELAALAQQHFGAGFDSRHLPASFTSTANVNEALAFCAKDAVFVVDEMHPPASGSAREVMHRDAARYLRAQGNASGRGRMRPDGSIRALRYPRCVTVATGEESPRGQSVHARIFTVEPHAGAIDPAELSECQADAANGLYAQGTAAFIRYLAARDFDVVRQEFQSKRREERESEQMSHARTTDIRAQLAAAYEQFMGFVTEIGALDADEIAKLRARIDVALKEAANAQAAYATAAEPVGVFFRLLASAIGAGRAHLARPDGGAPGWHEAACGWRKVTLGTGDYQRDEWQAQGDRVGWIEGDYLFLDRDAAYRAAQSMAADGSGIEVSVLTLVRRLHDKGKLVCTEPVRETLTIRRTFEGRQHHVLHLRAQELGINTATDKKGATDDGQ